ncbi:membrane protein [Marinithermofilum abyssi]|uniref:Membrane protein n=1 Tax=Marinithermofilum abyssi TaxID=1571185 RepID=A0A8J2VC59_9BACL|nr:DMT family transporter [Marinithermofilum abyssi]GGE03281.1 membrane protein [Marinithermofilum abyssi]
MNGRMMVQMVMVALFWAGVFPIGQWTVHTIHPVLVAFYRFVLTAVCLIVLLRIREPDTWKIGKEEWIPFLLLGATGIFAYNCFFFFGLKWAGAVKSSVIIASVPMVTAVLSVWLFRERLTLLQLVGVLLSFCGVVTVVTEGHLQTLGHLSLGDLCVFGAVASWTAYTLLGKRWMTTVSPLKATAYASLFGSGMLAPFAWIMSGSWKVPPTATWLHGATIVYMALFATVLAFVWWNDGVRQLGAGRAAIFLNLVPVFALTISTVSGHPLLPVHVAGAVLVITGVSMTTLLKKEEAVGESRPV